MSTITFQYVMTEKEFETILGTITSSFKEAVEATKRATIFAAQNVLVNRNGSFMNRTYAAVPEKFRLALRGWIVATTPCMWDSESETFKYSLDKVKKMAKEASIDLDIDKATGMVKNQAGLSVLYSAMTAVMNATSFADGSLKKKKDKAEVTYTADDAKKAYDRIVKKCKENNVPIPGNTSEINDVMSLIQRAVELSSSKEAIGLTETDRELLINIIALAKIKGIDPAVTKSAA